MVLVKDSDRIARAFAMRQAGSSYTEIGAEIGVTRQRAQQILRPSLKTRVRIQRRAGGACEMCRSSAGKLDIHHRDGAAPAWATYNADENLTLLCIPCHRLVHADPAKKRRRKTPEELADSRMRTGYKIAATRHGLSFEEYRSRREQGERWCSFHRAWEHGSAFKISGNKWRCIQGNREYVKQHQGAAYRRDYYQRNRERMNAYRAEWRRQKRARLRQEAVAS